ncbi:MAG TPA: Holliday junction resolvase RuvX [Candidatus Acidoferrales bacterium]
MSVLGEKKFEDRVASSPHGRILAIDYGRKRIGLALSDELGLTAQPLAVLVRKNRLADLNRLRDVCARHSVGHIIVGYPLHITGQESDMAAEATRFAVRLSKSLKIQTEMVDERLTSWQARQTVAERSRRHTKREAIDDVAAAVLLRDYIEHRRESMPASAARN